MLVCSKLLNFTKNSINYGVLFCMPVNPEQDGCSDYLKVISEPMDLGMVLNKIYLDIYKSSDEFWNDIGLVWKNSAKYNLNKNGDAYHIGLTLKEAPVFLYDQWYHLSEQRYNHLREEMAV